jgi:hypothetical protein
MKQCSEVKFAEKLFVLDFTKKIFYQREFILVRQSLDLNNLQKAWSKIPFYFNPICMKFHFKKF